MPIISNFPARADMCMADYDPYVTATGFEGGGITAGYPIQLYVLLKDADGDSCGHLVSCDGAKISYDELFDVLNEDGDMLYSKKTGKPYRAPVTVEAFDLSANNGNLDNKYFRKTFNVTEVRATVELAESFSPDYDACMITAVCVEPDKVCTMRIGYPDILDSFGYTPNMGEIWYEEKALGDVNTMYVELVTDANGALTIDKTLEEIQAAIDGNKEIVLLPTQLTAASDAGWPLGVPGRYTLGDNIGANGVENGFLEFVSDESSYYHSNYITRTSMTLTWNSNTNIWSLVGCFSNYVGYLDSSTTTKPKANGTAAIGTSTFAARADHVHPNDETKQDKLTGTAGQYVGFDADGAAEAQDALQGSLVSLLTDSGIVSMSSADYAAAAAAGTLADNVWYGVY